MKRLALLLLVAPLALAACGGSSSGAQPKLDLVAYVKHAARATSQTSEHLAMTAAMSHGSVSFREVGSGDFASNPPRGSFDMAMKFPGHDMNVKEVLSGTTVYVSSPLMSGPKKWIKLDLGQAAKHLHVDMSTLMDRDPVQAIRQLQAAGTVTQVGTETIDGVATTQFRVTNLDVKKLPQGAQIEALAHPTFGPIDVWIGKADGYVYRETMSITYTVAGYTGTMTMAVNLSKFGEAVHVSVPPASQTIDTTRLGTGYSG